MSIDQTTLLLDNLFNNINKKKGRFFVAEFQEQLVGFIAGYIKKTDKRKIQKEKKECVGHISKIYVKPEQRKKGIGRVLIEKMEEYFKENECDYATISSFAENDDAVCLYQKLGFSMRYISLLKPLKCKNLIIS